MRSITAVNAFVFVNKSGQKQAFRYHLVPERIVHLDPAEAQMKAPNFLVDEVQERLKKGPLTFHLKAQLLRQAIKPSDRSSPGRMTAKRWTWAF